MFDNTVVVSPQIFARPFSVVAMRSAFSKINSMFAVVCHPELVEILPSEDEVKSRRTKSDEGIYDGLDVPDRC